MIVRHIVYISTLLRVVKVYTRRVRMSSPAEELLSSYASTKFQVSASYGSTECQVSASTGTTTTFDMASFAEVRPEYSDSNKCNCLNNYCISIVDYMYILL